MSTPTDEIVAVYTRRKREREPHIAKMEDVLRHYDGKVDVPLPELDQSEKPAIPNLVGQGLDQFAMRVASTMPDIVCPPLRPGINASEDKARVRREAVLDWWEMNRMGLKLRKRARHFLGFGQSPVSISAISSNPLDNRNIPHWRVRDPRTTFPAPTEDTDDIEPPDCIFSFRQTLGWLKTKYPAQMSVLHKGANGGNRDARFEILEYNDAEETVLVVIGAQRGEHDYPEPGDGTMAYVELERLVNRAGIPLVVVPSRIALDKPMGAFDGILAMYDRQAKLDALELIAIQRGIFPDEWIVSYPSAPGKAEVIEEADGLTGHRGEIKNGDVKSLPINTPYQTPQAIDRLERAARVTAGIPAEFGAESGSNIRTARRGEMVMGASVDMPVQETQEIFQVSLEAENRRAIALQKAYRGSTPISFYIPSKGKATRTDYVPNDTFETDWNVVKYSMLGQDVNAAIVSMGQRVAMAEISLQTMREMDPAIEDAIEERDRVGIEGLRKALLSGLEQQASQGALPPQTIARIAQLTVENHEQLENAVMKAHQEEQARQQAQQQQQQDQQQQQGPPGAEAQPGLSAAGQPPMPPPPQGAMNLQQILQSLHKPPPGGAPTPAAQPMMAGQ